jgi:hypothetical protein
MGKFAIWLLKLVMITDSTIYDALAFKMPTVQIFRGHQMSSLLVKNVTKEWLREINYAAAKADKTQRDWIIEVLAAASSGMGNFKQVGPNTWVSHQETAPHGDKTFKHGFRTCKACGFKDGAKQ